MITAGLVLALLAPTSALAQDPPCPTDDLDIGIGGNDNEIDVCNRDEETEGPTTPDPGPPSRYVVRTEGDPPCWRIIAIRPSDDAYDSAFETTDAAQDFGEFLYDSLLPWVEAFGEMLVTGAPLEINPEDLILQCDAVSPDLQAYLVWRDTIVLPPPASDLDPGTDVVTGMDTYLTIGDYAPAWDADSDPRTVTYEGPIRIVATAEHQVDWGDETVTPSNDTWHQTNGRAWSEDGDPDDPDAITHVYQDATEADSTNTITVTTRWTARWETLDGSASGVVPFFRYSESTVDLDVDEVQPVVIEQS